MPDIFVFAGPNGAGKSTAAKTVLPQFLDCAEFVNVDDIARGLSAFRPQSVAVMAGRLMLQRLDDLARQRVNFAFETTLSSRTFAPWLRRCRAEGYDVHLLYFWLASPDLAVSRVRARVEAGGHDVPELDIRRRYERGRANLFELFLPLATTWEVYDNSGEGPLSVAFRNRQSTIVVDAGVWGKISN